MVPRSRHAQPTLPRPALAQRVGAHAMTAPSTIAKKLMIDQLLFAPVCEWLESREPGPCCCCTAATSLLQPPVCCCPGTCIFYFYKCLVEGRGSEYFRVGRGSEMRWALAFGCVLVEALAQALPLPVLPRASSSSTDHPTAGAAG